MGAETRGLRAFWRRSGLRSAISDQLTTQVNERACILIKGAPLRSPWATFQLGTTMKEIQARYKDLFIEDIHLEMVDVF